MDKGRDTIRMRITGDMNEFLTSKKQQLGFTSRQDYLRHLVARESERGDMETLLVEVTPAMLESIRESKEELGLPSEADVLRHAYALVMRIFEKTGSARKVRMLLNGEK